MRTQTSLFLALVGTAFLSYPSRTLYSRLAKRSYARLRCHELRRLPRGGPVEAENSGARVSERHDNARSTVLSQARGVRGGIIHLAPTARHNRHFGKPGAQLPQQ